MYMTKENLEVAMKEQLEQYRKIYINYYSSDCDGGHSGGHLAFTSVDEVYKWEEHEAEWADGPFCWRLTTPKELQEEYTYFTR